MSTALAPPTPAAGERTEGARTPGFRIFFDTVTVSSLTVLSKLAGALKTVIIAGFFGAQGDLDAYLIAFLIPSFVADVFCATLIPALVPRLVELNRRSARADAVALYGRALWGILAFICLAGAVLAFAAEWFAPLSRLGTALLLIMIPILPCSAVANIWRAVLNAEQRFVATAVTPVLTPIVIVVSLALAGHTGGVWTLAAGTTLGAATEAIALGLVVFRRGIPVLPKLPGALLDSGALKKEYGYLAVNNAVMGGAFFVNQSMAAMLGPGNISIFNFGTRFAAVLMAIGPAALSVTVLPRFSELAAERNWNGLKHMSRTLLFGWMTATAAATGLFIWFSEPIVRYALQRGAFTAADTAAVTLVQSYSLLQLPFAFGNAVLTRILVSLRANGVLIPFSLAALLMNAGLNALLMKRLGVSGIALSASVVQAVLFSALLGIVSYGARKRFLKES